MFDDAEARAFELAGQPPGPTTFRIGLRTFDAEERPVLEIVARVDLLGNEPPSREENARDLVDVEALMSIHDQMERFVREGKRRSGAFHGLSGVVPRRCDLDDVNAEGSQTRASDSDVRSPGLGGDGPRRPVGQLREPLTTARAKIEQVRRAPRVFDNCGRVIPRERLRVDPASKPAEVPSDEGLALGLVEHGVDPISLTTRAHLSRQPHVLPAAVVGRCDEPGSDALPSMSGLGEVFTDDAVARLYRRRPPYPEAVFAMLRRRLESPGTVLDAGAGTGALARTMTTFAERVDALDPSAAMIAEGRRLPGGGDGRLRWILGRAEDAPLAPPYGLITCGVSLHWMDLAVVLPRFREVLAPGAHLAIVDNQNIHGPYRDEVWKITDRYAATSHHPETPEAVAAVRASGVFRIEDEERTDPMPFEQSVEEYIEFLHSTSTLTRRQLGERAKSFDDEVRAVFARRGIAQLRYGVVGIVTWAAIA